MEHAKFLLTTRPELDVLHVALLVGYASHAAFTTAFKRATGVTPGHWRAQS
jgi:AraC-like DNA-binding protein